MERTQIQFKEDIINACEHIKEYIGDYDFQSFTKDEKTFYAVMMKFIIIGEAATHFNEEIRERNPDVRWSSVVGMRNVMAHDYFEVDPKILWDTATISVPKLKEQMKTLWLK